MTREGGTSHLQLAELQSNGTPFTPPKTMRVATVDDASAIKSPGAACDAPDEA